MDLKQGNIYSKAAMPADGTELTEILLEHPGFRIERIVSDGQQSPAGFWYEQPGDEWVILLQGKAIVEFEMSEFVVLAKGDYLWIPPLLKHRVKSTSYDPQCIWLAIHSV
jgi:cupin 2 domain-containing protein